MIYLVFCQALIRTNTPACVNPYPPANGANQPAIPRIEAGDPTPSEPCLVEQALSPWELLCLPTSHHYGYRRCYLKTSSMILYREDYSGFLRLRGLGPSNMLAVAVPIQRALGNICG